MYALGANFASFIGKFIGTYLIIFLLNFYGLLIMLVKEFYIYD